MTLRTSIRGLRARRLLRLGWSQETSSEHPRRIHSTAMLTAAEDKAKAKTDTYKLLIVGGGSAGTAVASKFAQKLDKHFIGIIEPSQVSVSLMDLVRCRPPARHRRVIFVSFPFTVLLTSHLQMS